jgi:hypothetical protein
VIVGAVGSGGEGKVIIARVRDRCVGCTRYSDPVVSPGRQAGRNSPAERTVVGCTGR